MKLNSVYQDIWDKLSEVRMKKVYVNGKVLNVEKSEGGSHYAWVEERAIIQTETASHWSEHADIIHSDIKRQLDILPNHSTIRDAL